MHVTGHELSVVDGDVHHGWTPESTEHIMPVVYGRQRTKSGGQQMFVAPLDVSSKPLKGYQGVDIKSGKPDGTGRGFVFLPPTVGISKTTGEPTAYEWIEVPDVERVLREAPFDGSGWKIAGAMGGTMVVVPARDSGGTADAYAQRWVDEDVRALWDRPDGSGSSPWVWCSG